MKIIARRMQARGVGSHPREVRGITVVREKRLILLHFIITRIIGYLLFSFALSALKTWTIHIPHLTAHYVNLRWGLTLLSGLRPDKNPREFIHDEFIRSKT